MAKPIDDLLSDLASSPAGHSLADLEPAVWSRIESRRVVAGSGGIKLQAAVAAGALALGVLVASAADRGPMPRAETILLSEDAGLALSIAVEGGA